MKQRTAPRRRGMALLSGGNAVAQVAALLRYALLARLLGPEQLGLAAILILTSQFFEAITDGGLDRFLIQSRAGNSGSANRGVHGVLAVRGLLIGLGLVATAGLFARFYHHEELRTGLMLLAAAPLLAGFAHLDYRRIQRHHDFGSEGIIIGLGEVGGLVATVIAALLTHSFVAVAAGLICRAAIVVALSHILARRPYRIGLPRAHAPAMWAFGAPLMINGVLLYIAGQGDRLIIGNQLGVAQLGHYSAVILLIFYPATLLSRMIATVSLPLIAGARDEPTRQARLIDQNAGQTVLLAVAMALGFAVIAPVAVPLIYTAEFAQPWPLVALIGILQATRFARLWPTTVALATGHSRVILWNGIVRLTAFPLAFALQAPLGGLAGIVVAFTAAEFMAAGVSLALLHQRGVGSGRSDWRRLALLGASLASIGAVPYAAAAEDRTITIMGVAAVLLILAVLTATERGAVTGLIRLRRA